ncbi:SAM-dependent methyltransferase [Vallitalea okinawensis]|uniref:SAM-dependent methyltransferase n=1 Tax=Vallitalea okinawensis TaxID=2078660 RepID=UPI000CFB9BC6|nr:SAM-dependent methyltransferase [Vallitalea okinawensis]
MSVTFDPIGKVKIEESRFFLELDKCYFEATLGLEEYSHLQVVWWFHLYDSQETRSQTVVDKPYKNGPEKIGLLATRSPIRPNPIAITPCPLIHLDQENHRIEIAYIDCENDTPILDIKPYEPSIDRVRDVQMPKWCQHWPKYYEESATFDWGQEFNF